MFSPNPPTFSGRSEGLRLRSPTAATILIEILVSVLILGVALGAALAFMATTNNLAEVNRNLNGAAVLCQERVAQVVAAPFTPPATIPSYFGSWPPSAAYTVTSTETVQLYTDTNGNERIPATRTTLVSLYSATTNLVRVTARVAYTYRGRSYLAETYTLRAPD